MPGYTSNHPTTNLPQFSMPIAHAMLKRCLCEECIEKGGYDEKGAPKGVLMAKHLIVSHILHVKAECTADNTSSVVVITDNLCRLTLDTDVLVNISLSSTVQTVELKPDTVPVSKKGCNQCTAKTLVVLDNIESRIQQCFHLLLHSCSIDHVGRELHLLRKAMQNVIRQTDIIIARKKAIKLQIDILATQCSTHEPSDDTPVEINTSK
ncbi:uncharacterized protein EDB93DRAFT_1107972 [Suillus bovinus]|uniref:uncharacterized protein n=1 Tax=Suillus bovinus TaxID=48563 RepID=UPI001B87240C|nr:uncharacterized protein EDB93DRAFT_1107972 [Suillus bovinus]KAG2132137.1 hypothetical protein EDB93DRAFT_1107972 [Suillus bovinus]